MYDELVTKANTINTTDTSDLVKKADYDIKIAEIEKKITDHDHSSRYITTQEFNKLTAENFTAKLKQAYLANKADIADLTKEKDFDNKLRNINKKVVQNEKKTCRFWIETH